jgi:hypothetical protein
MTTPEQFTAAPVEFPGNEAADGHDADAQLVPIRFAPVIAAAEEPPFTPYHAKYLAYELTKQVGADQAGKLAQSLCNATVDLNPHQVDAALFAFRSPLSRGAILADEVGLGKTIEAELRDRREPAVVRREIADSQGLRRTAWRPEAQVRPKSGPSQRRSHRTSQRRSHRTSHGLLS